MSGNATPIGADLSALRLTITNDPEPEPGPEPEPAPELEPGAEPESGTDVTLTLNPELGESSAATGADSLTLLVARRSWAVFRDRWRGSSVQVRLVAASES